jgi:carboxypeptidase Taq
MTVDQSQFEYVCSHCRETALLEGAVALLEWDERTGMPPLGGDYRAKQIAALSGLIHRRRTEDRLGDELRALSLSNLASDPTSPQGCVIHRLLRDYERDRRLPAELVAAIAEATSRGQQAWEAARKAQDFAQFLPTLERIIALKREAAVLLANGGDPYDALLDLYEPDAKQATLAVQFEHLRGSLVQLLESIRASPRKVDSSILHRFYPMSAQAALARRAAEAIGFDFNAGRLDVTAHPFCTTLGPRDIRLLTRYDEWHLASGLYGALHEAGHGLYEQGLDTQWYGLPPGTMVSLGIHESQSRLWENAVGRSRAFWRYLLPEARQAFPKALGDASVDELFAAVNAVRPSLIRVEADEVTYNLHIIIRFELERRLISGALQPNDLPGAWNEAYRTNLGISPANDGEGVLQDVHWSAGLFGYFPTYTLGNLAAAQWIHAARRALGDLDDQWSRGQFRPLLEWLREHVHRWGRRLTSDDLILRATGQPLTASCLVNDLWEKHAEVYGVGRN